MEERDNKPISESFKLDRTLPLGIWLSTLPYEKENSAERIEPFIEARLYVAGGIYEDSSGFARVDLEEDDGYRVSSDIATLGYTPSELLNLHFSWASIMHHDSYDTIHSTRRLTLRQNSVESQSFGGADNNGALSSPRLGIYLSGLAKDHLFYSLGYSSVADDMNFADFSTVSGRVAFEFAPITAYRFFNLAFGAFGMFGEDKDESNQRFSRIVTDAQIDIPLIRVPVPGLIRLTGAYLKAEDEPGPQDTERNFAWYFQAMFVSMPKGSPKWVPIARYDNYTENDGKEDFGELTLNLTYYFIENFRAQLEYWEQLEVPVAANKESSAAFQLVFLY